jgi:hypothetical protein
VSPVPVADVERAMAGLDRAALRSFVAALWAARGRETRTADGDVLARRPTTGEQRRVAVAVRASDVRGRDVDAVVTAFPDRVAGATEARVVGPETVRRLLRYAVDPADGERLARTHLGLALTRPSDPVDRTGRLPLLAATLLTVSLLAVAGAALQFGGDRPGAGAAEPTAAAAETARTAEATAESAATRGRPAGLGAETVEDLDALAARHREVVAGGTYALTLSFDGTADADGTRWRRANTTVRAANGSVYRIRHAGVSSGGETVDVERYADGAALYRSDGERVERRPLPNGGESDPYAERTAALLERYLSGTETGVTRTERAGGTRYRVTASGRPTGVVADSGPGSGNPGIEPPGRQPGEYDAVAYVTPAGMVTELRVSYTGPEGRPVSFRLRYGTVGYVEVEPPSWYPAARNATA